MILRKRGGLMDILFAILIIHLFVHKKIFFAARKLACQSVGDEISSAENYDFFLFFLSLPEGDWS